MGHWLSHQHDVESRDIDQSLKLVETWKVDHVQMREDNELVLGNRFSISEFGMIGISGSEKSPLSLMNLGTDKSLTVLSNDKIYRSATFLKIRGKEYLATACDEDGCLYLWDIQSETSKKVFDPALPSEQTSKKMNTFGISDNTVGFGEVYASPDRSRRVFILKTDKEQLTLSSTLELFTQRDIYDICYTEVDGTPCLLLCVPWAHRIMAVEMVGGKIRWEAGKEQMGEEFDPWSICKNQDDCAYVADFDQHKIHLLSASDGCFKTV